MGGRVKVFRGPKARREWSVGSNGMAKPEDVAQLQALLEYGTPPWVWIEPLAAVSNLLHPEQSVLMPGTWIGSATVGGAGATADGTRFGRSIIASGNVDLHCRNGAYDRLPVVPDVPVSGSFYASGTGTPRLIWINAAGGTVSFTSGASTTGTLTRRTVTGTPPAGAASVQLSAIGFSGTLTLPAYTFTDDPAPWAFGRGCNRATVEGFSENVQQASREHPSLRRSSISFTVREVG